MRYQRHAPRSRLDRARLTDACLDASGCSASFAMSRFQVQVTGSLNFEVPLPHVLASFQEQFEYSLPRAVKLIGG